MIYSIFPWFRKGNDITSLWCQDVISILETMLGKTKKKGIRIKKKFFLISWMRIEKKADLAKSQWGWTIFLQKLATLQRREYFNKKKGDVQFSPENENTASSWLMQEAIRAKHIFYEIRYVYGYTDRSLSCHFLVYKHNVGLWFDKSDTRK